MLDCCQSATDLTYHRAVQFRIALIEYIQDNIRRILAIINIVADTERLHQTFVSLIKFVVCTYKASLLGNRQHLVAQSNQPIDFFELWIHQGISLSLLHRLNHRLDKGDFFLCQDILLIQFCIRPRFRKVLHWNTIVYFSIGVLGNLINQHK